MQKGFTEIMVLTDTDKVFFLNFCCMPYPVDVTINLLAVTTPFLLILS